MEKLLIASWAVLFSSLSVFSQAATADLVVKNANVRTMDAKRTVARSIAVLNGKIVAIGSDADTKALVGAKTRVIDAGGKTVIPGFNDAHVHFMETGSQLSSVDAKCKDADGVCRTNKGFRREITKGPLDIGRQMGP